LSIATEDWIGKVTKMLSSKEVASVKAAIGAELAQRSRSLGVDAQLGAKYRQLSILFPEEI
jgi:hypothetical protein